MKLYLISCDEKDLVGFAAPYDCYLLAVVCANSIKEARNMSPETEKKMDWEHNEYGTWCDSPAKVKVKYLGEAAKSVKRGVVLASFNAG